MALHLLKLIWNRKRANFLIVTEILLSFLVLAAVTTVAVHYWRNYQAPLGFSYERIWDVHRARAARHRQHAGGRARAPRPLRRGSSMPSGRCRRSSRSATSRCRRSATGSGTATSRCPTAVASSSTATAAATNLPRRMSMPIVDGRWFSREDAGQNWEAVVINAAMARECSAPSRRPARRCRATTTAAARSEGPPPRPQRVVGVIDDFRQFGEYSTPGNYMFVRNDIVAASAEPAPGPDAGRQPSGAPAAAEPRPSRMPRRIPTAWAPNCPTPSSSACVPA